jgi:hypothetical protein
MGAAQKALLDGRLVEFGVGSLWVLQGERLGMLFIIIIIPVAMYLAIEVYIELIVDLIVEPPSLPLSLPLANQMAFVEPIDTSGGGSRHSYESID